MPCITIQFDPAHGPIINLGFAPPASIAGGTKTAPTEVNAFPALVDTGADLTCISILIAQSVKLPLVGKQFIAGATGTGSVNTYLADIALPFGVQEGVPAQSLVLHSCLIMEFPPNNPRYQALLGRDVLCRGYFSMTGYDSRFTICM